MKPLYTRLQEVRGQLGTPWEILERDYLLSWLLAGIGQVDALSGTLIFKGGTARWTREIPQGANDKV